MALAASMLALVPLPPLAKGDANGVVAVIWIALMLLGGLFNWLKKMADDAKRREEESRRAGRSFAPPVARPAPRASADDEDDEDPDGDADDEAERLRNPVPQGAPTAGPSAIESFEEYARRKRQERETTARRLREDQERSFRLAEEDRARALRERRLAEAAAAAAYAIQAPVAPVVTAVAPPYSATEAAEAIAASARAAQGAPRAEARRGVVGAVLPPEVAARITEAQRLFVGGEIFGRPRMWRPGPGGARPPRRKPAGSKG